MATEITAQQRASILIETLPYGRQYKKKIVVLKIGGNVIDNPQQLDDFAHDVVFLRLLEVQPVIVHGGGPQIERYLEKLGIKTQFVNGIRKTSKETMEIVEMVLCGKINKAIVAKIQQFTGTAVGIAGSDAKLIEAKVWQKHSNLQEQQTDFVGYPEKVNTQILTSMIKEGFIPVVAPVGIDDKHECLNINADVAAGAIACALNAERMLLVTDVGGVKDKNNQLIPKINIKQAQQLIESKTVTDGMIPKLQTCIKTVQNGVKAAVIIDGRTKHATLLELFTNQGGGTLVTKQ